jgi:hypothetical protein
LLAIFESWWFLSFFNCMLFHLFTFATFLKMSLYFFANLCHNSKSLNSNISFPTNIHLSFHLDCPKKIVYFSLYYDCFLSYNNFSTTSCNSFSCATRTSYIVAYALFLHHHTFVTFAFIVSV